MKFFVVNKEGRSHVFESKNKEALISEMKSEGENPSDFQILTLGEYQEKEIQSARLKILKKDNPQLSTMFPRTAFCSAATFETLPLPCKILYFLKFKNSFTLAANCCIVKVFSFSTKSSI